MKEVYCRDQSSQVKINLTTNIQSFFPVFEDCKFDTLRDISNDVYISRLP